MNIGELLEGVIARTGRTIYSEPVTVGGKTIIPVAKVSYGFGMGSGPRKEGDPERPGGGGGGLKGRPVGFIEVDEAQSRFVPIVDYQYAAAALAIGLVAGFLLGRARD